MSLSIESRTSERYETDGSATEFAFPFKIFDTSQLYVVTSADGGTTEQQVDSRNKSLWQTKPRSCLDAIIHLGSCFQCEHLSS